MKSYNLIYSYMEALLTAKEVRDILRISKSTLQRWEKTGIISSVPIGKKKKYDKKELERILYGT